MDIKDLTIEEKIGQKIMLGLDVTAINDEIINIIKDYKIGGVILYKKNYNSFEEMQKVINKLKRINKENRIPLFIAIDQENGRVNRFPDDITRINSARRQAKTKDLMLINNVNKITTELLEKAGVNMNIAPVLDISGDNDNSIIGNRSYGKTKDNVIKYGIPFMKYLQKHKIVSVIKHFPGHGLTNVNSHYLVPYISDLEKLEKRDLIPFEEAIKEGADTIMVGHLRLRGYGLKPASLNKEVIDKYLINKLNYKGVIISDDIKMGFIRYIFGLKNSAMLGFNAGDDIIIIKYGKNDSNNLYKKLYNTLKNPKYSEEINTSCKKIIDLKEKYQINDLITNNEIDKEKINKKIEKLNAQMK